MGPKISTPPLPDDFIEPELPPEDNSEIQAVVDVSIYGTDKIFRPVCINQSQDLLHLTLEDAKRLNKFLLEAIKFLEEYKARIVQ